MPLDSWVLEIVACPDTHHAPLTYDEAGRTLTCTQCRRVFDIDEDDLPVLLLDEARPGTGPDAGQAPPAGAVEA